MWWLVLQNRTVSLCRFARRVEKGSDRRAGNGERKGACRRRWPPSRGARPARARCGGRSVLARPSIAHHPQARRRGCSKMHMPRRALLPDAWVHGFGQEKTRRNSLLCVCIASRRTTIESSGLHALERDSPPAPPSGRAHTLTPLLPPRPLRDVAPRRPTRAVFLPSPPSIETRSSTVVASVGTEK